MELFIFARFHAVEGQEAAVASLLHEQVPAARTESGCLAIAAYRSLRDPRLFWIHRAKDRPLRERCLRAVARRSGNGGVSIRIDPGESPMNLEGMLSA